MRQLRQLDLVYRTHGGRRPGAGRPRSPRGPVPHRARPALSSRHPVHVTMRLRREVGSLRQQVPFAIVRGALVRARSQLGVRIAHWSVQSDHLHLLVEAEDRRALGSAMRGLGIRIARGLNGAIGRRGQVMADRYHARPLQTPREVRHALVYVLHNFKKHREELELGHRVDPFSSALWFDGWREGALRRPTGPPPIAPPSTWLLRVGWRRHASPSLLDAPAPPAKRREP